MKKAKIYTKTGDKGETALVSGKRISKGDDRIALYGELDELNSRLGVVCSLLSGEAKLSGVNDFLHLIQSAVFDLGSNLACEPENRSQFKLPQISSLFVTDMEVEIDRMENNLDPLKNFILPGGSQAAAHTHLARTCARNVERMLIAFITNKQEEMPENAQIFLNRLSDYLFVLARYINKEQRGEERLWKPRH
jgi:cob(I)alamin adenosyltransferase